MRFDVAPKYHLYRERVVVELDGAGAELGTVAIPAGRTQFDTNFQKNVEVLEGAVVLRVPLANANRDFRLRVSFQGCADEGLCYPPQTASVAAGVDGGQIVRVAWLGDAAATEAPATAKETPPVSDAARVESALKSGVCPLLPRCSSSPACCCRSRPACCRCCRSCRRSSSARARQVSRGARLRAGAGLLARHGAGLHRARRGRRPGRRRPGGGAAEPVGAGGVRARCWWLLALSMFGVYELQLPSVADRAASPRRRSACRRARSRACS